MTRSLSDVVSSTYSMLLIALMLGSIAVAMVPEEVPPAALLSEPEPQFASSATSPGHVVFGQYISSDNCGHCSKVGGGSDTHHTLKQNFPDEYVYVTYMSQSFGDTDTARAGKVGPYNWPWTSSGAPDAYFGDRTDRRQSGASSNYDTYDSQFSSGGGMHSTTNDYRMSASISPNGNTFDISIGYRYVGTGTPATNMKLYAAIVEEECTTYTYSSSGIPHGYHCWMGWLTSGDTYKTRNMGTGSAFHSVSVTSTEQTETWSTVPTPSSGWDSECDGRRRAHGGQQRLTRRFHAPCLSRSGLIDGATHRSRASAISVSSTMVATMATFPGTRCP